MHLIEPTQELQSAACHPQSTTISCRQGELCSPPVDSPGSLRDAVGGCSLAAMLAADAFGVPFSSVFAPTRGSPKAALVRQVAMYLAHVALGVPVTAVGRCFGRDHSTVAHGCRQVEDRRDDGDFDALIAELGLTARIACRLDGEISA